MEKWKILIVGIEELRSDNEIAKRVYDKIKTVEILNQVVNDFEDSEIVTLRRIGPMTQKTKTRPLELEINKMLRVEEIMAHAWQKGFKYITVIPPASDINNLLVYNAAINAVVQAEKAMKLELEDLMVETNNYPDYNNQREDKEKKDRIEAVNQAEGVLHDTESKMDEFKDQHPAEDVTKIKEQITDVRNKLADKDSMSAKEINKTVLDLQQSSLKIFEMAYKKMAAAHPTYEVMTVAAITALRDRKGSSDKAILKYIMTNYKLGNDKIWVKSKLTAALGNGLRNGAVFKSSKTSFRVASQPTYQAMAVAAITALNDHYGPTRKAILKYIVANNMLGNDYKYVKSVSSQLEICLKNGLKNGVFFKKSKRYGVTGHSMANLPVAVAAITALNDPAGSSRKAIRKYIKDNYILCNDQHAKLKLKTVLENGLKNGALKENGPAGLFLVAETGPATPKAAEASKAFTMVNTAAAQPTYQEMAVAAITALKEPTGSSLQAILDYIIANYMLDNYLNSVKLKLKTGLMDGLKNGALKMSAKRSGCFCLPELADRLLEKVKKCKMIAKTRKNKRTKARAIRYKMAMAINKVVVEEGNPARIDYMATTIKKESVQVAQLEIKLETIQENAMQLELMDMMDEQNPTYQEMAVTAINALKDPIGSSRQAICQYIGANYMLDNDRKSTFKLQTCLIKGLKNGTFMNSKTTGRFLIAEKAPAARKANKASTKPKSTAANPTYQEMAVAAITALKERNGSSRKAILKYIMTNYMLGYDKALVNSKLSTALVNGLKNGVVLNNSNGCFLAAHPTYQAMAVAAITALNDPTGSSHKAILKHMNTNYLLVNDRMSVKQKLRDGLKDGLKNGAFKKNSKRVGCFHVAETAERLVEAEYRISKPQRADPRVSARQANKKAETELYANKATSTPISSTMTATTSTSTKPKTAAVHPTYQEMAVVALSALNDGNGASRNAILEYIMANYKLDNNRKAIMDKLQNGLLDGWMNGTFREYHNAPGFFRFAEKAAVAAKANAVSTKPKIAADDPTYQTMAVAAITALKEPTGSSYNEILMYIKAKYMLGIDQSYVNSQVQKCLEDGLKNGVVLKENSNSGFRVVAAHPTYWVMAVIAITALNDRNGSSGKAILKYIMANYMVGNTKKFVNNHLKFHLGNGLKDGTLMHSTGRFRVAEKAPSSPKSAKANKAPTKPKTAAAHPTYQVMAVASMDKKVAENELYANKEKSTPISTTMTTATATVPAVAANANRVSTKPKIAADDPTYQTMAVAAITALNYGNGSGHKAILKYIMANYMWPWCNDYQYVNSQLTICLKNGLKNGVFLKTAKVIKKEVVDEGNSACCCIDNMATSIKKEVIDPDEIQVEQLEIKF